MRFLSRGNLFFHKVSVLRSFSGAISLSAALLSIRFGIWNQGRRYCKRFCRIRCDAAKRCDGIQQPAETLFLSEPVYEHQLLTTGTAGLTFACWWRSNNSGRYVRIFDFGNGPLSANILIMGDPNFDYCITLSVFNLSQQTFLGTSIKFDQHSWNHIRGL